MSLQKIEQELQQLQNNDSILYRAHPISESDKYSWHGSFEGSQGSPYQGGKFIFSLNFPQNYPEEPPSFKFMTRIFHPNVQDNGRVYLDILRKQFWRPQFGVIKVLNEIHELMTSPNLDSAFEPCIAYFYKNKREKFDKIAEEWTRQYAI